MQNSPAVSRRVVLGAAMAGGVALAACRETGSGDDPPTTAAARYAYGEDPAQVADLYRPAGGDAGRPGIVVVIHGGFWRAQYGLDLGAPLAADLAAHGWTAWNLEYRRVGNGGGWPATFEDIAAGIDHLAEVAEDEDLDLSRVVTLGHSAGGHLAAWAAARPGLPAGTPGASPAVAVTGVVAQAGVLDLRGGVALGGGAVVDFLGGTPDDVPERYDVADPIARLPLGLPVRCVHGRDDDIVPIGQSERFVVAATAAGDDATLTTTDGDHFAVIDVASPAWATIVDVLEQLS